LGSFITPENLPRKKAARELLFPVGGNLLSGPRLSLSFAAYAEARFSQQNKESRQETVQDHSERQSFAFAILAPAPHVIQERQA
jgi:hypothetical protein